MTISYSNISIFDLDDTLFKTNSSYQFGKYLYRKKVFSTSLMLPLLGNYLFHKGGFLSLENLHKKNFNLLFLNRSYEEFQNYAKEFLKTQGDDLIYYPAFKKLKNAQENNHYTALFSSSPDFLVALIAEKFGVSSWVATKYNLNAEKKWASISQIIDGEDKAKATLNLSSKLNVPLSQVFSYSDSYLDLPFLQVAGKAYGVNPDYKLKAYCKRKNWEII